MSTSVETNTSPVIEVPPKDETPAVINVDDHTVNTETAPVTTREQTTKVTPAQRLSSVFIKAKQTVTDVVSDAQKALNERKSNHHTTGTTDEAIHDPVVNDNTTPEVTEKKVGGQNNTFKGILNRVKGLKPVTTHPTVTEPVSVTERTTEGEAPVPPPKDNPTKSTETNPVLEQFKRNTTLLTNYLIQKKKEFTEKKSSDTNQETATPELHNETANKPASNGSPLVRRITQLVNNATASMNKKKKTETNNAENVEPTVVHQSPAVVTSTA